MAKDLKNTDKKKFGKEVKSELKKVVWPKPAELVKSTMAVIAIVIIIGIISYCLDLAFESINIYGIDKLAQKVQGTESSTEVVDESDENEEESDEEASDSEEQGEITEDNGEAVTENNTDTENATNSEENNVQ